MIDLACRQALQVTVVAIVAAAAIRWTCRRRPHLAYVLGLIVLVKCWAPPIFCSQSGIFCWPPTGSGAARQVETRREQARHDTRATVAADSAEPRHAVKTSHTEYRSPATWTAAYAQADARPSIAGWLFAAWLAGALMFASATGIRWCRWHRGVVSAATPPGTRLLELATATALRFGLRRVPRLLVATSGGGPAAFGIVRPVIVVPDRLLTAENADDLLMVLTHEMLHIRRGDLYVSLFQFATLAAWWFHPAIWWISRRLTQERERSCDEEVLVGLRCSPAAYAQCLLDTLRQQRHEMVPAFPGMRAVDVTQHRIEHIMLSHGVARGRTPLRYWLFAGLALLVILPGQRINLAVSEEAGPPASAKDAKESPAEQNAAGQSDRAARDEDASPPRSERLVQAIDRGIRYLKTEQRDDGHWPDPVGYPGGITSLCTLTLLKCGMKPDEHTAESALEYLRAIRPSMTYNTSLQTLVFCAADAQAERKRIQRNVDWIVKTQKAAGPFAGAWGYPQAEGDNSNTAFAVWALYEADRVGVAVANAVWSSTLKYWLKNQNADGSWGYKPRLGGTGSMTSQGMFCVAAAAKVLGSDKPDQPAAKSIEKAAAWLANHFSVEQNPGSHGRQGWQFYYLLALAKAGRISGRDQFGEHRWSAEVVDELLDKQQPDGSWKGTGHAEDDPQLATGLALLSLMQNAQ